MKIKIISVRKVDADSDGEEFKRKQKLLKATVDKLNNGAPVDASSGSRMEVSAYLNFFEKGGSATFFIPYAFSEGTQRRLEQKVKFYQDCLNYSKKVVAELKKFDIADFAFKC